MKGDQTSKFPRVTTPFEIISEGFSFFDEGPSTGYLSPAIEPPLIRGWFIDFVSAVYFIKTAPF